MNHPLPDMMGATMQKLREMVAAQGGDTAVLDDPSHFAKAKFCHAVRAEQDGFLCATNAESIGAASVLLGAGRETKDSAIDFAAGIVLAKKAGDFVRQGDVLATLYAEQEARLAPAQERFCGALTPSADFCVGGQGRRAPLRRRIKRLAPCGSVFAARPWAAAVLLSQFSENSSISPFLRKRKRGCGCKNTALTRGRHASKGAYSTFAGGSGMMMAATM